VKARRLYRYDECPGCREPVSYCYITEYGCNEQGCMHSHANCRELTELLYCSCGGCPVHD
jgi:hypothetical protein